MASWSDIEASDPAFAAALRARFDAHKHKILGTLRQDGSPRLTGIEAEFRDGELWLGMMIGSRKALDLRRDPRLALHTSSEDAPDDDPSAWSGDAKLSGRAVELTDPERAKAVLDDLTADHPQPPPDAWIFRVEITEAVLTSIGEPADHLLIQHWRENEGVREFRRA